MFTQIFAICIMSFTGTIFLVGLIVVCIVFGFHRFLPRDGMAYKKASNLIKCLKEVEE